jgi:hypothetical protein
MFDHNALMVVMERELRAALDATVTNFVATARVRLEGAVAEVAEERAKGLAEVAERAPSSGARWQPCTSTRRPRTGTSSSI